jgi:hypothetical protein
MKRYVGDTRDQIKYISEEGSNLADRAKKLADDKYGRE